MLLVLTCWITYGAFSRDGHGDLQVSSWSLLGALLCLVGAHPVRLVDLFVAAERSAVLTLFGAYVGTDSAPGTARDRAVLQDRAGCRSGCATMSTAS